MALIPRERIGPPRFPLPAIDFIEACGEPVRHPNGQGCRCILQLGHAGACTCPHGFSGGGT